MQDNLFDIKYAELLNESLFDKLQEVNASLAQVKIEWEKTCQLNLELLEILDSQRKAIRAAWHKN